MVNTAALSRDEDHEAVNCPLMLEGQNPVGFNGMPFEFGVFSAVYYNNCLKRRPGVCYHTKLKLGLNYMFKVQFEVIGGKFLRDFFNMVRSNIAMVKAETD